MSKMPSYDTVAKNASDVTAFSNGTEADAWMSGWCLRPGAFCKHDSMQRGGDVACPLLDVAMLEEKTPAQWTDRRSALGPDMYRCTRYEAEHLHVWQDGRCSALGAGPECADPDNFDTLP